MNTLTKLALGLIGAGLFEERDEEAVGARQAGLARGDEEPRLAEQIASTARRAALRLAREHGMAMDDIFIDMSVSAIIADTEGLNRATLDAVKLIGADPELALRATALKFRGRVERAAELAARAGERFEDLPPERQLEWYLRGRLDG